MELDRLLDVNKARTKAKKDIEAQNDKASQKGANPLTPEEIAFVRRKHELARALKTMGNQTL